MLDRVREVDMTLITSRVSRSFKVLRRELGDVKPITQQELAERIGVPQQSLANWESGRSVPKKSEWDSICSKTGKDLGWFFLNHSEPVEIIRGPAVEAFRAFERWLSAMGGNGFGDVKRMGIPMRPKTSPRLRPGFSC